MPTPKKKPTPRKPKRVISEEEKKLRNKVKYQQSKKRVFTKALERSYKNLRSEEGLLDVKGGSKSKYKTEINENINKAYKVQNEIDKLYIQLEKYNYAPAFKQYTPKIKGDEIPVSLGLVWQVQDHYPDAIFKNVELDKVNGFDKKKEAEKIIALIHAQRANMGSKAVMYLLIDENFNGRIVVQNEDFELE